MNGTEAIRTALANTQAVFGMYLADLTDADLLQRPVPGANHIAWQVGHLINSEINLVRADLPDTTYPELPAGFAERHGRENAGSESTEGFGTKEQYLDLFNKVRGATIAAVSKLTDADLDRPSNGPIKHFAPTVGAMLLLVSNHTLMHAGQFTVVRRKLGKPVAF